MRYHGHTMKWRVWLGWCVTMAACARDDSAPVIVVRDAGPDEEVPAPEDPAPVDAGGEPTVPDSVDAGEPEPEPDAASPAPECSGSAPDSRVDVGGATFSDVSVNGAGNRVTVASGERLSVELRYELALDACAAVALPTVSPRIGFAEGNTACSATGTLCVTIPGSSGGSSTTLTLTAPSAPGEYGVYGALEHGTTIGGGTCDPYGGTPDEATRIATVCVE